MGGCPSGTVLITSGSTSSAITVMTNDDELREGDERFTLSLTEVLPSIEGRISISTVSTASVTIEANDEDGSIVEIGFLPTDYRVLESAGIVTLTVSVLSGNILTGSVTVLVTTSDGSAVAGEDYTSVSESLVFDSVVTVRTVAVLLSRDGVVERLEDFVSVLSSTSSDALLSSTRATVTIGDEDRGEISVVSESESVPEGSAVRFTVELGDGVTASEDLSVSWSVDCSGSVTSVDFVGGCPSGTVLITSGSTSSAITVMTNDDELREGDERFTLSLTEVLPSIEGRISISTVSTASVTIEANDEDGSIVEIGFLPTDYRVLESAGIVTLTVSVLSGNILTGSVTVLVTTSDGSAVAGEDYTSVSESLVFDSVVTVRTVAVLLSRDGVVERLEDFVSVLSSTSSDALLSSTRATVTIGDEDRGEISVVSESESVPEGSAVRFTVELGDGVTASEDLSVSWSVDCSGSVTSVDFAGFGDVCPSGTVLITSGSTSSAITVMTNDDELREGDERFTLSLTEVLPSIEGRISISTVSTASVTIEANDEDGSIVEIGFLPTDYRVLESAGIVTLTVSVLSGNILTGSVTVLVTTSDGSAVAGEDTRLCRSLWCLTLL